VLLPPKTASQEVQMIAVSNSAVLCREPKKTIDTSQLDTGHFGTMFTAIVFSFFSFFFA
jgi:hypothetical protein